VLMVTRLDRLAQSTGDLLNTLAAITGKKAGFHSSLPSRTTRISRSGLVSILFVFLMFSHSLS
jgi:DNA invertase Pin-like site-specific DNA recombinase